MDDRRGCRKGVGPLQIGGESGAGGDDRVGGAQARGHQIGVPCVGGVGRGAARSAPPGADAAVRDGDDGRGEAGGGGERGRVEVDDVGAHVLSERGDGVAGGGDLGGVGGEPVEREAGFDDVDSGVTLTLPTRLWRAGPFPLPMGEGGSGAAAEG